MAASQRLGPLVEEETFARLSCSRDFLAASFDQPVRLADAASVACLSPFHRIFAVHSARRRTISSRGCASIALNSKIREASRDQTEARDFYVNKLGFDSQNGFHHGQRIPLADGLG